MENGIFGDIKILQDLKNGSLPALPVKIEERSIVFLCVGLMMVVVISLLSYNVFKKI